MKILLAAINAKYIHTSLSVRALAGYARARGCGSVSFCEYTINMPSGEITADLYRQKPDVICFSCYIWNIIYVREIAANIKKILPGTIIVCGGSEVSYDSSEFLEENPAVDAVISGEGEESFYRLCKNGFSFDGILGVTWRKEGKILKNPPAEPICDIDSLPFPYTREDIEKNRGKLIYYETSRGCPFGCSYCISSTIRRLRFRSTSLVEKEMRFFVDMNVPIVKLTDRTFNADPKRTAEILRLIIEHKGNTTFHFEVAADLLNEELLEILENAPENLFQLEIGVQSTNPDTIHEIDRTTDFEKISSAVKRLKKAGNIHLHLDLIAGLPHEDIKSFANSFDRVFELRPHVLQLGFLKLLKGTKIRREEERFHYRYTGNPPYEVLSCDTMDYGDILTLKGIENVFEKYYNSGAFERGLEYILKDYGSPFSMFRDLAMFFEKHGYDRAEHSRNRLYELLCEFAREKNTAERFYDELKMDYLTSNKPLTPPWSLIPYDTGMHKKRFELISGHKSDIFSVYEGKSVNEILKAVHFERFVYDVDGNGQKADIIMIFDIREKRLIGKLTNSTSLTTKA